MYLRRHTAKLFIRPVTEKKLDVVSFSVAISGVDILSPIINGAIELRHGDGGVPRHRRVIYADRRRPACC